jgi:hypothetical protein
VTDKEDSMSTPSKDPAGTFDLLSPPARQRLIARIRDAGGDVAAVRQEVAATLSAHDKELLEHGSSSGAGIPADQALRAFYVAQIAFLDGLAQSEQAPEPARGRRLWSRLSRSTGRT